MSVIVTETASKELKRVMEDQKMPEGSLLRIGVASGGCSGFQYKLGFDEKYDEIQDHVSEQHGVKIAVDKKSALLLDGTTLDFHEGLERRGFTFDNPNVVKSCGCGNSFS
ncbi:probable iron binding protein from the HesB_IscA_SufA family [hydrothermal vent metagenome]|uniref:Probable iron binding protein from the HesB_IscA_SufA family n=1 Tax=hydrothermal vent metagenome TaxID=652676 RepID=A0A3B1D9Y5_9ZZZZ